MTQEKLRLFGSDGPRPRRRSRAFNLLEMLLVMLLIGLFAAMTYISLNKTLPRVKLRGKATEVVGFLQKARLGAIRAGMDMLVKVETYGADEKWLVAYRRDTAGVETEMGRLDIGSTSRPYEVYLAGVESGGADLVKANTFPDGELVYRNTGNSAAVGAFRVSIGAAEHRNTLEIAVQSLGGQPVVRKYIRPADRPDSATTTDFFEETHYGTDWEWSWY